MRSVVLISMVVAMLVASVPSIAQEGESKVAAISTDTDGDGLTDNVDACPLEAGPQNADPKKTGCTARALARQWVLAFLTKAIPPGRKTYFTHAQETQEEGLRRYTSIANDVVEVIYNPRTKPLFSGPTGRSRTVSLLLGVMFWETGFRRDVDFGLGAYGRGDRGNSWCLMQLHIGTGKTPGGYSGPELVSNRKACISEGLKVVQGSLSACKRLPLEHRLSAYASGSCDKGREKSEQRVGTGVRWFTNSKALRLFKDEEVLAEIQTTQDKSKEDVPQDNPNLVAKTGE